MMKKKKWILNEKFKKLNIPYGKSLSEVLLNMAFEDKKESKRQLSRRV